MNGTLLIIEDDLDLLEGLAFSMEKEGCRVLTAKSCVEGSGGIVVDKDRCRVFRGEEEIPCSRIEYQLLVYFIENKNQVLSKEQILASVWDNQGRFVDDSTVSVNIRRLRAKIEDDPKNPERIRNVYGIGYIWREDGI